VGIDEISSRGTFTPKKALGKFMRVSDHSLNQVGGKSLVFFMGAGFCPFCASERWAIVKALNNFGRWEGLRETMSADHDEKYLNIPTFSFSESTYKSDQLDFVAREISDRNFEPLQELSEKDYEILEIFNPDQMIPFVLIGGQFMQVGSGYSPKLLQGMDHAKARDEIENQASPLGRAIKMEADNITALICKTLNMKSNICDSEDIRTLTETT
jgi:thiol-disulfide isomerase/thioredoxin